MKLANNSQPVELGTGDAPTSSFRIAMNGKAFRVLSDNLYQNKIGSIVREISCNAFDGHTAAGKSDIPFVIHLPDAFEPWFSVQDFGVGISPDNMESVFTVFFESTKSDSNSMVGCFGLGCKTPLAYTDQFTVTSVYNGMCRVYSVYITESGIPSIIEVLCNATDDINGVEVKLSVKREDFGRFSEEVATQLRFFKVKPLIQNANNFKFNSVSANLVIDSANVSISNDSPAYGQPWAHIIQGNVGYPLDVNQVKDHVSPDNRKLLENLQGSQVRFHFNIGDIGVTASREGVEYNKHTLANIDAKLTATRVELNAYITAQIAAHKTDWAKALFLNSSVVVLRLARAAGITLANMKPSGDGYYNFDFNSLLHHPTKKDHYGNSPLRTGMIKVWTHGKTVRDNHNGFIRPSTSTNVYIALRDTNSKPNIRAKHFLSTLDRSYSLIEITLTDDDVAFDDKFIKSLTDKLGGMTNIIRLSDIEPPVRESTVNGVKVRVDYTRPTHYSYTEHAYSNIRQWNREFEALDDNEDETVYIVIKDMAVMGVNDDNLIRKYIQLSAISDTVPLVGIRENDVKKIDGNANYIKLEDYIKSAVDKYTNSKGNYIKWRHQNTLSNFSSNVNHNLLDGAVLAALNKTAPKVQLTKMLNVAKRGKAGNVKLNNIAAFMGWKDDTDGKTSRASKLTKAYKNLLVRYPLASLYGDWQVRGSINAEHLAKYVSVM